jgi:peptide methionine sulfoxide reductase MsrA
VSCANLAVYCSRVEPQPWPRQRGFFPAEDYHQDYLTLHPYQLYIAYNDLPKVENLKRVFAESYVEKPTLAQNAMN